MYPKLALPCDYDILVVKASLDSRIRTVSKNCDLFYPLFLVKYLKNKKYALLIYVTLDQKSGQKHKYES